MSILNSSLWWWWQQSTCPTVRFCQQMLFRTTEKYKYERDRNRENQENKIKLHLYNSQDTVLDRLVYLLITWQRQGKEWTQNDDLFQDSNILIYFFFCHYLMLQFMTISGKRTKRSVIQPHLPLLHFKFKSYSLCPPLLWIQKYESIVFKFKSEI